MWDAILEDPRSLILVLSHPVCKYASIKMGGEFDILERYEEEVSPHAAIKKYLTSRIRVLAFATRFDSIAASK